jgi:hypothetical protein
MSVLMYQPSKPYNTVRIRGKTMIKYMMTKGFIISPYSLIKES